MNIEQKAVNVINVLSRDYTNLIGLEGIGMYIMLMRVESVKLGVLDMEHLSFNSNMELERAATVIKKLHKCGLIELKSKGVKKYSVKTLEVKPISFTEKLFLVDEMFKEKLISYEEKREASEKLNAIQNNYSPSHLQETEETEKAPRKKRTRKPVADIDLLKIQRRRNPNSCPALVDDYYKVVSKYFGQYFISKNVVEEAHMLKENMRKFGDSPDTVRKLFEYVASQAKSRNDVEGVRKINYYLRSRDVAYFNVFTNPSMKSEMLGSKKEGTQGLVDSKYIKEMYDYFKTKNYSDDIIRDNLESEFGKESVAVFLQTLVKA